MLDYLEKHLPKIVLAPTTIVMIVCMYGFIAWTGLLSLTKSRMMPQWEFVGLDQYFRLFANPRWDVAVDNLFIFLILFIIIALVLGLLLAIFLDQRWTFAMSWGQAFCWKPAGTCQWTEF